MASTHDSEFWLCYRPLAGECIAVDLVNLGRVAVLADTAQRARAAGFTRVRVFSTVAIDGLEVERTQPRQLVGSIVAAAGQQAAGPVCYAGAGMPAMTAADWAAVRETIESGAATANRMFSCDWIGVPDGRLFSSVRRERVDNRFAQRVRDTSAVAVQSFPRSAHTLLDLDTPADLVVLKTAARVGSLDLGDATQAELRRQRELDFSVRTAVQVFAQMTRRRAELMVSGRVSGSDWAVLDRDTACRVRVLSEERGLRTRGKPARSLLAELYQQLGAARFVEVLTNQADALIWDTRPFLSHLGWEVTRCDRFWADLGRWDAIADPRLRELVAMLDGSAVLLGGHSLVSGGLRAAIDTAWSRRERGRKLPA